MKLGPGTSCLPIAQKKRALARRILRRLETVDLDGLRIELQPLLLISQELLHIFTLIPLKLDHLAHLRVVDDGSIAGELLLDHLEDLLLVELLGQALDSGQRLATIAFW